MFFLLIGACATAALDTGRRPAPPPEDSGQAVDSGDTDSGADTGPEEDSGPDTASEQRCEDIPPLPPVPEPLPGLVGAEDFAFDADGNVLFINGNLDLVAQARDGTVRVISPHVARYTAGTRFLPDGKHVMVCDVTHGSLLKIDVDTGDVEVVLGGLEYPNGLEVDPEGYVYVSEETSGVVRRVDPSTGDYEVVAAHLYRPNGLRYRASDETLFIGSFGAGYVWAVTKDGAGGWSAPRVAVKTPLAPGQPCEGAAVGDDCSVPSGYLGACADDGRGGLACEPDFDVDACVGLADGDPCTTHRFGNVITSQCVPATATDPAFCPASDGERVAECAGRRSYASCEVDGHAGLCNPSWQGVSVCSDSSADVLADIRAGCADKALYDACVSDSDLLSYVGQCVEYSATDGDGLACTPPGLADSNVHGGLDGLNLDECGNLYVTELSPSMLWRFTEEGGDAELVYTNGDGWIPNLHWGSGVGGWDPQVLYASERIDGMLIGFDLGVRGEADAYPRE